MDHKIWQKKKFVQKTKILIMMAVSENLITSKIDVKSGVKSLKNYRRKSFCAFFSPLVTLSMLFSREKIHMREA